MDSNHWPLMSEVTTMPTNCSTAQTYGAIRGAL